MGRTAADESDVFRLIGSIYDAALSPARWSAFMSEAFGLFQANQGTVVLLDERNPEATIVETPGFNPDYLPEFYARRDSEDYWWLAARNKPAGSVFIGSELVSTRDMRKRPIYHEVARFLDAEFLIGGVIDKRPGSSAYFSLVRSKRTKDFNSTDKELVQTLLPHLRRALLIHQQVASIDRLRVAYESALNRLQHGVVICDARGSVIFFNSVAEAMFQAHDGLTLKHHRIQSANHSENARLQTLLSAAARTAVGSSLHSPGGVAIAHRPSGKRPYCILVSPLSGHLTKGHLMTNASVIAFISDPTHTAQPASETIAVAFGLTKAEVRVCQALAEGLTTSGVAEQLDLSVNTVKTHLKQIFRKTDVRSKGELLQVLSLHAAWDAQPSFSRTRIEGARP